MWRDAMKKEEIKSDQAYMSLPLGWGMDLPSSFAISIHSFIINFCIHNITPQVSIHTAG